MFCHLFRFRVRELSQRHRDFSFPRQREQPRLEEEDGCLRTGK